jgi:hypothetical protein
MTLFNLTGPLAASAGVGALWGPAHENHESTLVLWLLVVGGLVAGLGLAAASRYLLHRRPPQSEAQAVVVLIFTFALVLTGTLLAGHGTLILAHSLL